MELKKILIFEGDVTNRNYLNKLFLKDGFSMELAVSRMKYLNKAELQKNWYPDSNEYATHGLLFSSGK